MISLTKHLSPDIIKNLSYNRASQVLNDTEWRYYEFCWRWCAVRFSNVSRAGALQDAYFERFGSKKFWKRINRVRKIFGLEPIQTGEEN